MGRIQFSHSYETIISIGNLLEAWKEFSADKDMREDVAKFRLQLMSHLLQLRNDLKNRKFVHGPYMPFKINDTKPRDIHKATVRDRILHRALYRKLYPFFDRTFISDSYSCRLGKGTHRALKKFNEFDQFMKHKIKTKYYIRYADDFVILNTNREWLESIKAKMDSFLKEKLHLSLHPNKTFIKTFASGVDFLGWTHFSDHRVLRTTTRRRMMNKCSGETKLETVSSYLGMLKHGNAYKYQEILQPIHDRLLGEFLRSL